MSNIFFCNATATPEIFTLSLHDALPIFPAHAGVQQWVADLNQVYRSEPALYEVDFDSAGFEWIDCHDADASVLRDRKSTRLNSSHITISYAVFCLKKKIIT